MKRKTSGICIALARLKPVALLLCAIALMIADTAITAASDPIAEKAKYSCGRAIERDNNWQNARLRPGSIGDVVLYKRVRSEKDTLVVNWQTRTYLGDGKVLSTVRGRCIVDRSSGNLVSLDVQAQ